METREARAVSEAAGESRPVSPGDTTENAPDLRSNQQLPERSLPPGLTSEEAEKRLAQFGPNEPAPARGTRGLVQIVSFS
jgi:hypothetical protein